METATEKQQDRGKPAGGRARKVIERPPKFQGWRTTDDDEIERRRWRGRTDIVSVGALEPEHPHFGTYRAVSTSGGDYVVEIRSLSEPRNSCGCRDFETNGLGTCKHIEGVVHALRGKGKRAFSAAAKRGGPRIEVFVVRDDAPVVAVQWPAGETAAPLRRRLEGPLAALQAGQADSLEGLRAAAAEDPGGVRLSRYLDGWLT